jgi:chromate transporter
MTPISDLCRVFGRIGLLSFGGPAAQISLMHRILVDERRWLTEAEYLRALSFCMLLPGPEAMQLATYSGWRLHGIAGGLIAGGLFVLPGAALILLLAALYVTYGDLPVVRGLLFGVKACVVVIVVEALLRVSRRALKGRVHRLLAIAALIAIFLFSIPFPLIVAVAAGLGILILPARVGAAAAVTSANRSLGLVLTAGSAMWFAPLLLAWAVGQDFLLALGLFFSKLAVVTFGGAYAVLAYMTQDIAQTYGWVTTAQMMDALGLAETTPGPLILVTEFVAYVAGYAQGGTGLAMLAAILTLWVTFVPCFIWIFAFAPYVEWIATRPQLSLALEGVMAAVVGVIANLSLWFALQLFFADVTVRHAGPVALPVPDPASFDPKAAAIAGLAALALLRLHWPLLGVLGLSALAGLAMAWAS